MIEQVGTAQSGSGASVTLTLPTEIQDMDIIVLLDLITSGDSYKYDAQANNTGPLGYLSGGGIGCPTAGATITGHIWSKFASPADAGKQITFAAIAKRCHFVALVFRGRFDPSTTITAVDASNPPSDEVANTVISGPQNFIGGETPSSMWIGVGLAYNSTATGTATATGTGWASVADLQIDDTGGKFTHLNAALNTSVGAPNGATYTWSQSQTKLSAYLIELVEVDMTPQQTSKWDAYEPGIPNAFTALQWDRARSNIFSTHVIAMLGGMANSAQTTHLVPSWGYTTSVTRSEASPGTDAAPNRRYWYRGSGNSTKWVKAVVTYTSGVPTTVALYYSEDNESSYVKLTDDDGNYVATLTWDGTNTYVTSVTWGITP